MLFPLRFKPSSWHGPRTRQYSDRSDAFQQLVGDALREQFGWRANISPTEGRDGSIDAFVVEDTSGSQALADQPAPQIIECKDHDDTRGGYLSNVTAGWSRVAQKLARQAAAGWPGLFRPWQRARSYAYCVSAVLPNQEERDKLHRSIERFFDSLPASQRPPLEKICVLDWADLRDLFDRLPRVADQWLGTGLQMILGHAEYCASLTRFRRYLLSGYFPFVEPEAEAKTHPRAILRRLEALAGASGVVLKGVGGIGKTRTAMEVGYLADAMGWRVLHVLPGEPGVTVEDLSVALLEGIAPTLLVFDYLDQMPKLDLGSLRKHLLPEAERRGTGLALIANLRPSSLRRPNAERDALFTEEILLQPTSNQKSIIAQLALDRIAPLAVAQLGRERVRELCGERPIIAMFIAEELQRRAQEGTLTPAVLVGFRSGDLLGWLRRRLIEDRLVVVGGNDFLPPQPEPSLIVAAAMLAAAPLARDCLEEAGRAACQASGGDGAQMAGPVLEGLFALGWLEPRGTDLAAAHDVVADEVLAQVLWDRASGKLRDLVLPMCLAPALGRARVLGRYATALTRLLGPEAAETETEAALRIQASDWLQSQSPRLGQMLASAEVSESAYALGGIISAPAWTAVCVAEWHQLVAPWLAEHGTHAEARHLLYSGLKELPEHKASGLLAAALLWLPEYLALDTASYVLGPLVARPDLGEHAPRAMGLAMNWLEKFPRAQEVEFVLKRLFGLRGLNAAQRARCIAIAAPHLEILGTAPEASHLLKACLRDRELAPESAHLVVQLGLVWIRRNPQAETADYIFNRLMRRPDLPAADWKEISYIALTWLAGHKNKSNSDLTLAALLTRPEQLEKEDLDWVLEEARRWLTNPPRGARTPNKLLQMLNKFHQRY